MKERKLQFLKSFFQNVPFSEFSGTFVKGMELDLGFIDKLLQHL
jgi:hypothetical protein